MDDREEQEEVLACAIAARPVVSNRPATRTGSSAIMSSAASRCRKTRVSREPSRAKRIERSMAAFQLVSPFEPAGDQPQAIDRLVDGLRRGRSHQTLLGVTGSGKTFTMANVIAKYGRPALVMSHNKTLAAQ